MYVRIGRADKERESLKFYPGEEGPGPSRLNYSVKHSNFRFLHNLLLFLFHARQRPPWLKGEQCEILFISPSSLRSHFYFDTIK